MDTTTVAACASDAAIIASAVVDVAMLAVVGIVLWAFFKYVVGN